MPDWIDNTLVWSAILASVSYLVWRRARAGRKSPGSACHGCCSLAQNRSPLSPRVHRAGR